MNTPLNSCGWQAGATYATCDLPEDHAGEHHFVPMGSEGNRRALHAALQELLDAVLSNSAHAGSIPVRKAQAILRSQPWGALPTALSSPRREVL